jgi:hypothetical protein
MTGYSGVYLSTQQLQEAQIEDRSTGRSEQKARPYLPTLTSCHHFLHLCLHYLQVVNIDGFYHFGRLLKKYLRSLLWVVPTKTHVKAWFPVQQCWEMGLADV